MRKIAKNILHRMPMKRRVFEALRTSGLLPERVYRHLYFTGWVPIEIDETRRFYLHHWGDRVENELYWGGFGNSWEATSLRVWLRLATGAQTVLDIGANTGVYALAASTVNPSAKVFAFEPSERTHTRLQQNIARNGYDVTTVCAGASNRDGTATFYDTSTEHQYSASLEPTMLQGRPDLIETEVATIRLEGFLRSNSSPGPVLAKIDTEQHEAQVLEGFGTLLAEWRPTLLIEILNDDIGNKVAKYFHGLDYLFYEIHEGSGLRQTTNLGGAERNYLVCPRTAAERERFGSTVSHAELDPRSQGFRAASVG